MNAYALPSMRLEKLSARKHLCLPLGHCQSYSTRFLYLNCGIPSILIGLNMDAKYTRLMSDVMNILNVLLSLLYLSLALCYHYFGQNSGY